MTTRGLDPDDLLASLWPCPSWCSSTDNDPAHRYMILGGGGDPSRIHRCTVGAVASCTIEIEAGEELVDGDQRESTPVVTIYGETEDLTPDQADQLAKLLVAAAAHIRGNGIES